MANTDWLSRGNALLAKAMKKEDLRRCDIAELMNRELVKLGAGKKTTPMEVAHWIHNRRTVATIPAAVALERLFGIPIEAWIRKQPPEEVTERRRALRA